MDLSKEHETIFEDFLIKLFDKSLEGLNETLNEVINLEKKDCWYDLYYYKIHNLKTNIKYIEKEYDFKIKNISNYIKEQEELTKNIFQLNINNKENEEYLNELFSKIDNLIENTTYDILLISIFSSIALFSSIQSILSLFTGTGVLGIIPITMGIIINNTASQIMFKDKLKDLNQKLTFIIQNIKIKKNEQLQNLKEYFNNFLTKLN